MSRSISNSIILNLSYNIVRIFYGKLTEIIYLVRGKDYGIFYNRSGMSVFGVIYRVLFPCREKRQKIIFICFPFLILRCCEKLISVLNF